MLGYLLQVVCTGVLAYLLASRCLCWILDDNFWFVDIYFKLSVLRYVLQVVCAGISISFIMFVLDTC